MSCAAKPSNTALSEATGSISQMVTSAPSARMRRAKLADRAVADDGDVLTVECMLAENALHGGHACLPSAVGVVESGFQHTVVNGYDRR